MLNLGLTDTTTFTSTEMSDEIRELRERVAVSEATIKAHAEVLDEVKDAVKGINASLHSLTRLEERAIAIQENQTNMKEAIKNETADRKEMAESFGRRIGDVELMLSSVGTTTAINEHGRTMQEKILPPLLAAVAAAVLSVGFTLLFSGSVPGGS